MAARIATWLYLLEQAKSSNDVVRSVDVKKARKAKQIQKLKKISRDAEFIKAYRLSEDLINMLESELTPHMPLQRRRSGLENKLKILCALSFLASGSHQKMIGKNKDTYVSQPSASRAIRQVIEALNSIEIINKYIQFPQSPNNRQELKERFYEKFKIPGVVGCIGGTLVSMIRPKDYEHRYYCGKNLHARNVLIINDADFNILHIDVTFGGATDNSFVFSNSRIKDDLENLSNNGETVYLLGGTEFPQRPYLMTPFNNPEVDTPESHYNNFHSSAMNSMEKTIRILKGRFRCLLAHKALHYDPIMVEKIVKACCVLHNICNQAGLPAPQLDQNDLDEEAKVLGQLAQRPVEHNDEGSGLVNRGNLVNQLWQARHD